MLPLELVLEIVTVHYRPIREEFINPKGPKIRIRSLSVLTNCSLVCHAWLDICRPLIFRSIYKSPNRLSFLHYKAPHLCKYTIELCLGFSAYDVVSAPDLRMISACLSRFINLRHFEVVGLGLVDPASTELWARDLASILSTINLKRISLLSSAGDAQNDGLVILPILSACSDTLEELAIDYFFRNSVHGIVVPSVMRFEALRKVELSGFPSPQTSIFECPNLESFTITRQNTFRDLPPWVPENISEITLRGTFHLHSVVISRLNTLVC